MHLGIKMSDKLIWNTDFRPIKSRARDLGLLLRQKPKENILLLPGEEMLDLFLAIDRGVIKGNTKVFLVERNKRIAKVIQDRLDMLPIQARLFNISVEKFNLDHQFDFVSLDMCGCLTLDLARWIRSYLNKNLVNGSDLNITLQKSLRRSYFAHKCQKKFSSEILDVSNKFRCDKIVALFIFIIQAALPDWQMNLVTKVPEYKDTTQMVLLMFRNLKRLSTPNISKTFDTMINKANTHW
jgi:hypothetical protein